jgi:TrkA domain protein
LSELLGAGRVTETVSTVRQQIEGLAIEWIDVGTTSPAIGHTIAELQLRTRTGASVVAVIRGDTTVPAPEPDLEFAPRDVVVAVGTDEGLATLRSILGPAPGH